MSAIENLYQAIRQQISHNEHGLAEQIKALVDTYQAREAERERVIATFQDEEGDVLDSDLPAYDETVDDYGHAGREDLVELLGKLTALLPA
ncbi:hypothetical protein F0344_12325 [Streptomyces finlayi]|uniref:Uncharacterized protein n=1 Tax=Streptomyces finlayi TaxID=67296 RepID=A0A7G7BIY0_9ACTN|nr:hypothetical protein [Streptomyces finlayi]QNE75295.1 hypothetical protein F0344_12325 [Streptomyces finlayi]